MRFPAFSAQRRHFVEQRIDGLLNPDADQSGQILSIHDLQSTFQTGQSVLGLRKTRVSL